MPPEREELPPATCIFSRTATFAPTFEWTKKQGVVWRTDLTGKGGHSARRCLITEEGTGQGILIPFMKKLKELGVPVLTGMKVIRLDKNKDGRVIGVTALEDYKFGKDEFYNPRQPRSRRRRVSHRLWP